MRKNISSGTPWESEVGYSRAVRVGRLVEVSGTTAVDDEGVVGGDDPYAQTVFILQKIEKALGAAGMSMQDVIRTRIYITDAAHWRSVGKAHAEVFGDVRPAATMVVVKALIDPALLVEIEATAAVE